MTTTATATDTHTATATDLADPVVASLTAAFAADPVIRWFLPDPVAYLTWFPQFVRVAAETADAAGSLAVDRDGAGAALWIAGGSAIDEEAFGGLVAASVPEDRHEEVFAVLELMDQHHPDEPVWYLPFMGVDPAHHGKGVGSELLRRGLRQADEAGAPAYLEASTERNRALYERHGFEVVGEIAAGTAPPFWPMLRPAR